MAVFFPFPHPDNSRRYFRKFIVNPIHLQSINDVKASIACEMIKNLKAHKTIHQNFGLVFDAVDISKSISFHNNCVLKSNRRRS